MAMGGTDIHFQDDAMVHKSLIQLMVKKSVISRFLGCLTDAIKYALRRELPAPLYCAGNHFDNSSPPFRGASNVRPPRGGTLRSSSNPSTNLTGESESTVAPPW